MEHSKFFKENSTMAEKGKVAEVLRALEERGKEPRKEGKGWMAFCPSHADGTKRGRRSLSIGEGHGGVLLHCFAGCDFRRILEELGLPSLSSSRGKEKSMEATYTYTDGEGRPLYRVIREVGKKFRTEHYVNGEWKPGVGDRRVPYRFPQVLRAVREGKTIYVVEGEKCVHAVESLGLIATTSAFGAKSAKQWAEWGEFFNGAKVVILPDNDESGRKFAVEVRRHLSPFSEVDIVELPGLAEKEDIVEWIEKRVSQGKGEEEIRKELVRLVRRNHDRAPIGEETSSSSPGTDAYNSYLLFDRLRERALYVGKWGWCVWTGVKWVRDDKDARILKLAKEELPKAYFSLASRSRDKDQQAVLAKCGLKAQQRNVVTNALDMARGDLLDHPENFDQDPWLLNLRNGILDLKKQELLPHDPGKRMTKVANVEWVEFDGDWRDIAPTWASFLERVLPDPEIRAFLQRAVGYSLTGDVREQKLFFLYGSGANGKT
ncbi:MAG: hypothetical protein D6717_13700, partial [Gammaproteobacteria bacterium]